MAKAKKEKEVVYYGELWRFGYDLQAVCHTEEELRQVLIKTYRKWYRDWNGCSPSAEEVREANECIEVHEFTIGEMYRP